MNNAFNESFFVGAWWKNMSIDGVISIHNYNLVIIVYKGISSRKIITFHLIIVTTAWMKKKKKKYARQRSSEWANFI